MIFHVHKPDAETAKGALTRQTVARQNGPEEVWTANGRPPQ
jgi:hypothetical protein